MRYENPICGPTIFPDIALEDGVLLAISENYLPAALTDVSTRSSNVLDRLAQAYKTPLTAILAASAGLSEMGHLSPTQADLVALIGEQANILSDLTSRLLTAARVDASEVSIHETPVGVEPVIDDVVTSLRDRLAHRKVLIDLEDDNLALFCDRNLIVILLSQYLDNASKYSIVGTTITIRAVYVNSMVVFSVHNFGPVIPETDRECIFDRDSAAYSYPDYASGAGVGLSVAKRIASIHGGNVWVTSGEQEGTTFFAAIPDSLQRRSSR